MLEGKEMIWQHQGRVSSYAFVVIERHFRMGLYITDAVPPTSAKT